MNEIDASMISALREMLEDLEQSEMDIGDLIVDDASVAFKPLRENLEHLRAALRKYKLEQQKAMQVAFAFKNEIQTTDIFDISFSQGQIAKKSAW